MSYLIREVNEQDDFEFIVDLENRTLKRFNSDPDFIGTNESAEEMRIGFFPHDSEEFNVVRKGYVAEQDGKILGFVEVIISKVTKNGTLSYAWEENYEHVLNDLIECCIQIIRDHGGSKLMIFAFNNVGQVRNKGISFWEKLGFVPDEYSFTAVNLHFKDWNEPPKNFDESNIEPALHLELEEIKQMLLEDGEDEMAEMFQRQFFPIKKPDQVILQLRDKNSNQIAGIAYYCVNLVTGKGPYFASGFWIHFRPSFKVEKNEKVRFLQAVLLSMKQINISWVTSRLTTKNFDVFTLMIKEGFEAFSDHNSTLRLVKKV